MTTPDRIWAEPEIWTCGPVGEEPTPDGAAEYLARDGETVTALVEALARLCNEMEMPGEKGVLHGVPAALENARAALDLRDAVDQLATHVVAPRMTGPSEIEKLRRQLDEARQQSACARRHAASLAAKNAKQRNEIGRLTREAEDQKAQIRDLTFEINKMRAAERQRREMQTEARADHG